MPSCTNRLKIKPRCCGGCLCPGCPECVCDQAGLDLANFVGGTGLCADCNNYNANFQLDFLGSFTTIGSGHFPNSATVPKCVWEYTSTLWCGTTRTLKLFIWKVGSLRCIGVLLEISQLFVGTDTWAWYKEQPVGDNCEEIDNLELDLVFEDSGSHCDTSPDPTCHLTMTC